MGRAKSDEQEASAHGYYSEAAVGLLSDGQGTTGDASAPACERDSEVRETEADTGETEGALGLWLTCGHAVELDLNIGDALELGV